MEKKGWVCLDIDGTLTDNILTIPHEVLNYLEELHHNHWQLVFVTGRTFSLAARPLETLQVPYHLIAQNGASCYEMPQRKMIFKKYLPVELFIKLEKQLIGTEHDFVLFTGYDQGEDIFYRPERLSESVRQYFESRLAHLSGCWKPVESFHNLQHQSVPYGKIYGVKSFLQKIEPILKKVPAIQTHLVVDSVNNDFHILQIMDREVDKGKAVAQLIDHTALPKPIISAGNDTNDGALLQVADIRIAMKESPACLLDQAHIIAPSVHEMGILPALKLAVEQAKEL